MKTSLSISCALFLMGLFVFTSCNEDSSSPETPPISPTSPFSAIFAKDGESDIAPEIDLQQRTIHLSFSQEALLDSICLSFTLADGVSVISPELSGCDTLDLTQPMELVFSRNGETESYQLTASTESLFKSIHLLYSYYPVQGRLTATNYRIDFELPLCTTEKPDLSHIPVIVEPATGITFPNAVNDTLWLDFAESGVGTRVFVEKNGRKYSYRFYVNVSQKEPIRTEFTMNYGTNLCYWFQEEQGIWYDEKTIDQVKSYGFDHVRLPFDSKVIFYEDGTVQKERLEKLHYIINYCLDAGLNVILDMHWLRYGNSFPNAKGEKELAHNWTILKEEFKQYPNDRVAYEILNEPWGGTQQVWCDLAKRITALIRSTEPERVVFISTDGYEAQDAGGFSAPKGDPNIVMAFHFYEPMLISHRGLYGYTGPSHYPGRLISDEEWEVMSEADRKFAEFWRFSYYGPSSMLSKVSLAAQYATLYGVRIHCGEFGVSKGNIRSERLQWFRDIVTAFKANNIPYTCWETFGGDFGCGTSWGSPDEEVIDILVQRD